MMTKISLTKKQFENLLKLIYLGNWMINGIRSDRPGDKQIEKYNEVEQYIYSFAKDYGFERYIEFDQHFNQFFPTREFEECGEIEKYKQEYDDETLWEDLIMMLARRDFIQKYGIATIQKMSLEEKITKETPFEDKYRQEFEKNGLDNLRI